MSIIIFDIDQTLVCSKHRTPRKADGTVDLDYYRKHATRENIFKDTLLPLADEARRLYAEGKHYIIFCTARHMHDADYLFLQHHGLKANTILSRDRASPKHYLMGDAKYKETWLHPFKTLRQFVGKHMIMFDDERKVITAMRNLGITCFNAVTLNERLAK
jgi:FMN phosphatase YigB (HAD superfamily)